MTPYHLPLYPHQTPGYRPAIQGPGNNSLNWYGSIGTHTYAYTTRHCSTPLYTVDTVHYGAKAYVKLS